MKQSDKKSPLKAPPLRNPGQSLDEEIDQVLNEELMGYIMMGFFAIILAILEWIRWLLDAPYRPFLYTLLAVVVIVLAAIKIHRMRSRLQQLRLGRDGERAVGQYLDQLQRSGYRIFHDVIGDNFNIDHVIISNRGIFAVETKTYRKPQKGRATVTYNGEQVLVNGFSPDRNPVAQVTALSDWLRNTLLETTGKNYPVKGAVLFPGWWVENSGERNNQVWVLNPKALPKFLENAPAILPDTDVKLATYHLSRYIRTH